MKVSKDIKKVAINAQDVADYILAFANDTGEVITNLKLQKLLYYVQAWHLANFEQPLFGDEFEAWVHGPVVPALYREYKSFSKAPIVTTLKEKEIAQKFDSETLDFLKEVMKVYIPYGGYQLELMTHKEDPWVEARDGCAADEHCSNVISIESMKTYYGRRIQD